MAAALARNWRVLPIPTDRVNGLRAGHSQRRPGSKSAVCSTPGRPAPRKRRDGDGFVFRLETADGAPAEPPTLNTAVPNWSEGDCVPLGKRTLRVIGNVTTTPINRPCSWWRKRRPSALSD